MPVFNGEKFISQSVQSILSQTHKNLELIIMDDGSTDRTVEIISSFKDSRIRLFENKQNKGNLYRRNEAFKMAEGDFIAIMDADDVSVSERLFLQKEVLKKVLIFAVVGLQIAIIHYCQLNIGVFRN